MASLLSACPWSARVLPQCCLRLEAGKGRPAWRASDSEAMRRLPLQAPQLWCPLQRTCFSRFSTSARGSFRGSSFGSGGKVDDHARLGVIRGFAAGSSCFTFRREEPTTLRLSGTNIRQSRPARSLRHRRALFPNQTFLHHLPPSRDVCTSQSAAAQEHEGSQALPSGPNGPSQSSYSRTEAVESDQCLRGLDHEQRAAVLSESRVIRVVAGPGTGKTRVLTSRVAHLILHHQVDPADILCVTFTNRAAQELRDRLESLLQGSPHSSHRVMVGTFHHIAARLLRHWIEPMSLAGRDAYFAILDDKETLKALKTVKSEGESVGLTELEEKEISRERDHTLRTIVQWWRQQEVMGQHVDDKPEGDPMGQSTTTNLVAEALRNLSLEEEAMSGGTNQQGPLAQTRSLLGMNPGVLVSALLESSGKDPNGEQQKAVGWDKLTMDSLPSIEEVAERLARVAAILSGTNEVPSRPEVSQELRTFLEGSAKEVNKMVSRNWQHFLIPGLSYGPALLLRLLGYMPPVVNPSAESLQAPTTEGGPFAQAGDHQMWAARKTANRIARTALLQLKYEALKRKMNAVDFDDLLVLANLVVRAIPGFQHDPRFQFSHILVDEFQDTDTAQYELVRLLVGGSPDGKTGPLRSLFVVGDIDQAIYGFRGADHQFLQRHFDDDYPECQTLQLSTNYRSTPEIISAASQVIRSSELPRGIGPLAPLTQTTVKPGGPPVEICRNLRCWGEAERIAWEVKSLARHVPHRNIAVLYRWNVLARNVEKAFIANSIPFVNLRAFSLLERKGQPFIGAKITAQLQCRYAAHVSNSFAQDSKNLLAYLRLAVNPLDSLSLARIINEPRRGIGRKTVRTLNAWAKQKGCSLAEALDAAGTMLPEKSELPLSGVARRGLQEFQELMAEVRALLSHRGSSPGHILRLILEKTRYMEHLLNMEEGPARRRRTIVPPEDDGEEASSDSYDQKGRDDFHLWWEACKHWDENSEDTRDQVQVVKDLLAATDAFAEQQSARGRQGLQQFLENLVLEGVSDDNRERSSSKKDEGDAVQLLTMHASKGLEFDTVFIIGMEQEIMPGWVRDSPEHTDEERRVFYVAITRAQQRLYISHCRLRFWPDKGELPQSQSQFLDALQKSESSNSEEEESPCMYRRVTANQRERGVRIRESQNKVDLG